MLTDEDVEEIWAFLQPIVKQQQIDANPQGIAEIRQFIFDHWHLIEARSRRKKDPTAEALRQDALAWLKQQLLQDQLVDGSDLQSPTAARDRQQNPKQENKSK